MIAKGHMINERYQIIKMIGEGGMANVYLAHDTILDRDVAVKVLRGDLADDEKFVRRFQIEAIAASSLNHPNIVEMYDVGEDEGKYFIVMEYIEGQTLKSLIKKRGALTLAEVIDIMLQLTSGIACAPDTYIIHRDIKPQNVLILDDGRVKITDFGIAMALNSNELTQTNSVMGSVHYLPPEQANGSGSTIKSDIYSLGILMYELLTGKVPFKGDNAVEIAIKHLKEPMPSVCEENPEIPQSIENIILKACAKNPKNRYDSVMEMHNDIKTALTEERRNEPKITYSFVEQELEETKVMPNLKDLETEITDTVMPEKKKKVNVVNLILIIFACLLALIVAGISIFSIVFSKMSEKKEVVVPDVANMSVVDAEQELKKIGLNVATEVEEKNSPDVEEGNVISSKPQKGRTVKVDTEITLVVSSGASGLTLGNYVGQNSYEVKGKLEAKGIYVLIEKKEIDENDKTKYQEDVIIEQKPESGTKAVEGDTVTLYIPNIVTQYPDFVAEAWPLSDIQTFCKEYGINLQTEYEETDKYKEGAVIKQSRSKGAKVMSNTTLKITIAKKPTEPDPVEDLLPTNGES